MANAAQPAVSECGSSSDAGSCEQVVPPGKAENLDDDSRAFPADRARGPSGQPPSCQLSRPARIKTFNPPPAMNSEPRRRECSPP